MYVIHKYPLYKRADACFSKFTIDFPVSGELLSIQLQDGIPTIWVKKSTDIQATYPRVFRVVMTGEEFDLGNYGVKHLATLQSPNGIVSHVFEEFTQQNYGSSDNE